MQEMKSKENKMNKEEILQEIEKTKEHLTNMENMLKECSERWKPEPNEEYYYVNQVSATSRAINDEFDIDAARYRAYNCFRTKKEAELEAEKILVRRQLEDIARRLNRGERIDWDNDAQRKYFIRFNYWQDIIELDGSFRQQFQGVIYCLDKKFLNVAIKEIGEGRLIKYLRGK